MPGRSVRLDHSSLRSNTPDILAPPNRSITPRRVPTESRAEQLREMSGRPTDCRSPIYRPEDPDFPREQTRRNGPCRDKSSSRSKGYSQRAAMGYCASFPESCRAKRRRGGIEQRRSAGLAHIGESFSTRLCRWRSRRDRRRLYFYSILGSRLHASASRCTIAYGYHDQLRARRCCV